MLMYLQIIFNGVIKCWIKKIDIFENLGLKRNIKTQDICWNK